MIKRTLKNLDASLARYMDRPAPVRDGIAIIIVFSLAIAGMALTIANSPLPQAYS